MATLAPYIFQQYFDDDGAPLASGTVTAYTAGTTDKKAIYTTAAGDVEHSNPFTLDTAGRKIYYLGSGTYDFLIKDSDGNTVDTVEDVSSTGSADWAIVDNIAALRALADGAFTQVSTQGYTTIGDGGHSTYRWDADSTDADDNGLVIRPSSAPATGRWLLQNNGYINDLQLNGSGDLEITAAGTQDVTIATTSGDIINNALGDIYLKLSGVTNLTVNSGGFTFATSCTFTNNGAMIPRVLSQDGEPASGTGATQILPSEALFWIDTNDSDRLYLVYNQATTVKKIELT